MFGNTFDLQFTAGAELTLGNADVLLAVGVKHVEEEV
jgi:hypothetical protein